MNPLEILSLIFAIMIIVKFLVFLVKPDWLLKTAEKLSHKKGIMNGLFLVLVVVLGYFVLSNLTITQVMPGILLGSTLVGAMMVQYPGYLKLAKTMIKDKKKVWLFWLIWLVLACWVLVVLFIYS